MAFEHGISLTETSNGARSLVTVATGVIGLVTTRRPRSRSQPSIEDVMADLATMFHWSPAIMDLIGLPELMGLRERAARRASSSR